MRAIESKSIVACCFAFILFPFVGFFVTDLQPFYALILGLFFILVLLFNLKAPFNLVELTSILLLVIIMFYALRLDLNLFEIFRTAITYSALILVIFFLKFGNVQEITIIRYIRFASVTYLIFAFLELNGMNFMESFLSDRPRVSRGVRSLAPEPSMFGYVSILLFSILREMKTDKFFDLIILTLSCFLAGSASALLILLPLLLEKFFSKGLNLYMIIFLCVIVFTAPIFMTDRLTALFSIGIFELITDESINERAGHIFYIFTNPIFFVTGGDSSWGESYFTYMNNSLFFFNGSQVNNVLSGLGSVIYDGGIFGTFFLLMMLNVLIKSNFSVLENISRLYVFFGIFIQSVSLANPILCLWIAIILRQKEISPFNNYLHLNNK